ncbi:hypothetical protein Smp_130360 [Schistosoma mansoni]|uniref:hypothetical protein n=1 Tax=Schistosoma mansoni TaxID=6183 RepID=UPI0001A64149|nr:hypothetical protein Smp_130360 [Schistosoma mansoni]|eukprot:XP_018651584.1 hypothetical protein Smp_130360 [Schistosoma mansoni]
MVCERLKQLTELNLQPAQLRFRRHLSTVHVITIIRHIIQCALNTDRELMLTFIDFTKAFNSLPKELVLDTTLLFSLTFQEILSYTIDQKQPALN